MLWSKAERTQSAQENKSERKDEPEQLDNLNSSDTDAAQYPGLKIVLPTVLSVCLAVFLTALVSLLSRLPRIKIQCLTTTDQDRTIVGVAVPSISNQFDSFDQISWYESAYLLTFCAFQLPMGKIYVRLPSSSLDVLLTQSTTDLFLCQMDFHHSRRNLRDRLNRLRRRPHLSRLHSRPRDRRHRERWYFHGRNGHLRRLDSAAETA